MPDNFSTDKALRVSDPVITSVVQGYSNSEGIASFVAPAVPVDTRSGQVIRFGKEHFAVMDLNRAPGGSIKRVGPQFTTDSYTIRQHAIGSEVPREVYEEAINGEARLDFRTMAAQRAAALLGQSWESQVVAKVYNAAAYETSNVINVAGTVTDMDDLIAQAQEQIRSQIGRYANSAVIGADTRRLLRRSGTYRDRIKYTSSASVSLDMISAWWDLSRGVRAGTRQKLNESTGQLENMVPAGSILLFFNPEGSESDTFIPAEQASAAEAAFAYTYQLRGYPMAEAERFDDNNKSYVTDLIAEQDIQLVGMGQTGKVGAACLITNITGIN